ncbi:2-hydroxyacid dehydrogenase [Penicillium cataractarum]|uniref:2-hydroxyacid dehydrogenase n=1 Tax=Penicillium cataractarum TaxID=2100454 RepID=A0A9W9RG88_9EURO|nr:2-hydroxyacid dehydrogenase [Penicillium cataractarum]KAJ5359722.1 2-hydroxyacid dehydrogenase [Penicillium cataractarum]
MKLSVFSAKSYDRTYLDEVLSTTFPTLCEIEYHTFALSAETAPLASTSTAVSVFVNDTLDNTVLHALHATGVRAILLRCAGFNHVDLVTAEKLGLFVANVPAYSPEAVAEFAVTLVQTLNRKTHRAYTRVREGNFNIEGLLGTTLHGKTVGIVGVGRIGLATARIFHGFGCRLLAYDPFAGGEFEQYGSMVELDTLLAESNIVSLHCPLTEGTRHLINEGTLARMKPGAMLVNTSRGGLIDSTAVIEALKTRHLGGLALDVYEAEGELFYNDHSGEIIDDDVLMRLMTFPNVLICGHQGFFTSEALTEIAGVTLSNLSDFAGGKSCANSLVTEGHVLVRRDTAPVRL